MLVHEEMNLHICTHEAGLTHMLDLCVILQLVPDKQVRLLYCGECTVYLWCSWPQSQVRAHSQCGEQSELSGVSAALIS